MPYSLGSLDRSSWRWRFGDWTGASWAWVVRSLLVLFIISHHVLLIFCLFQAAGSVWVLAVRPQSSPWWLLNWAGAVACGYLAWLLLCRLQGALPGLVTASHDADDQEINGTKLSRSEHPALFQLVEDVAQRVGVARPDEIWVSADARCFAFEQRGFGVTTKRLLILVIGLPHLLVLSAAELRVIISHELAHIQQRDTTLAVFLFRFAESLRTYLRRTSNRPLGWLNPVAWFEWVSYQLFQALIAPVQRGQEIRADRRSAELFGGDLAHRTLLKEWLVASQFAALVEQRLDDSHGGRPADQRSVHQQFVEQWREISPRGRQYLQQRLKETERESYWDTHPSLSSRLRAVAAYPNIGYEDHQPASSLLSDTTSLLRELGDEIASDLQLVVQSLPAAGLVSSGESR